MHWYYPRTPTLRDLQPVTWAPWLRQVRASPPVTFDRGAALALIGHAHRALAGEVYYVDDPGQPWQREGPMPALPPGHELQAFEVVAGWRWERPTAREEPWALEHDDGWWMELPAEVGRAARGDRLQVPAGWPTLELATGRLAVGPHVVAVLPGEDPEEQDLCEELDETVIDLTGFVGVDEHGLLLGPFPCPACGHRVLRDWDWAVGEPLECTECGTDVFTVRALPTPTTAPMTPRHRLDVLQELGIVVLKATPSSALRAAVDAASCLHSLMEALLCAYEVDEVYGDDATLQAFLDAW
jgi:hypothetical protein